jgi:alkanesulfonate monooxygenase SsuD/methylene tetrahydromethanopterin reductase-like flavin-dependent oxidoreductase (luciferase family)
LHYDVFFSISQTPVGGRLPGEREMFENFFRQVEAADRLGFSTAWLAEAHLSSQVQKQHRKPVIPHWEGEVGLNVDFLQLATRIFARTERIECGSAVMNILCNGGPIAAAERIAAFATQHGLDSEERRRIHVGFAAGRFDFNNAPTGVRPRNAFEDAFWPAVKGKVFDEATEIFLRLLRGDVLGSEDIPVRKLTRKDLRSDEEWDEALRLCGSSPTVEAIEIERRWTFEPLQIVPRDWRRELVQPVIGSHDAAMQDFANTILPTQVFNLSITQPKTIEDTHHRMRRRYHRDGGAWRREYMPRTVFVFLNGEPGLDQDTRAANAREEADQALGAYWTALEGTLDPAKVEKAADNALVGNPEDVAAQVVERFHPKDRLMLWFDFFNHDCDRVIRNMQVFMEEVVPRVEAEVDA